MECVADVRNLRARKFLGNYGFASRVDCNSNNRGEQVGIYGRENCKMQEPEGSISEV